MRKAEQCHDYISLVFFDDITGEAVTIGGAGFLTEAEFAAAWANVPEFEGQSSFQADHLDAQRDIVGEKAVSAETCETLMGKPIASLIAAGRAQLAAELAELHQARAAA